jgi:hypothetical protein
MRTLHKLKNNNHPVKKASGKTTYLRKLLLETLQLSQQVRLADGAKFVALNLSHCDIFSIINVKYYMVIITMLPVAFHHS